MTLNNGKAAPNLDNLLAGFEQRQQQKQALEQAATKQVQQEAAAVQLQITVGQVLDEVLARDGDYNADDVANGIVRLHMLAQTYHMSVQDLTAGLRFLTERWSDGVYKPHSKPPVQD